MFGQISGEMVPREMYVYPKLKITQKQIDKHNLLCERFKCNVALPLDYEIVEDESDAETMGAWYGMSKDVSKKPGIMYIAILPDGSSHS
tara:strand:+ start:135 stop:401 length:267 start_codon:yes stop_codon:yes gene_type:complete